MTPIRHKIRMTVTVDPDIKTEAQEYATVFGRTLSSITEDALREFIKNAKKAPRINPKQAQLHG